MAIENVGYFDYKEQNQRKPVDSIPRYHILFENSCKSKMTFVTYKKRLDAFLDWSKKDY